MVVFNRRLAVTPKHRLQQVAVFALLEIIGISPATVQGSGPLQTY